MKRSGTAIVFLIVWAAVLFAAFVIGICIREVRFQRAGIESKADIKPAVTDTKPVVSSEVQIPGSTDQLVQELSAKGPMLSSKGMMGGRNLPGGQRGGSEMGRGNMGERFANMSEEERQKAMAQMRERFAGMRRGGGEGFQNLSEEERAKMEEERRLMRERYENMSEEERAKMREEIEKLRERWEEMSEEEREDAREQMQERYGFVPRIGIGGRPGGGEGGRRRPGGR